MLDVDILEGVVRKESEHGHTGIWKCNSLKGTMKKRSAGTSSARQSFSGGRRVFDRSQNKRIGARG